MRHLPVVFTVLPLALAACDQGTEDERGGAQISIGDDKGDGSTPVELVGFLAPSAPVDGKVDATTPHVGYLFSAQAGTKIDLEITHGGTSSGIDTVLKVYGPRDPFGNYPVTVAEDDDGGYGALSKIQSKKLDAAGFYLADITTKTPPTEAKNVRLVLTCSDGSCERTTTAAPIGLDIRWEQTSAEIRAASLQAYGVASARIDELAAGSLPSAWTVVMDIDETTLMNVAYQRERAELGAGYSSPSWLAWVQRKAAAAMPGAKAFIDKVRGLGGKVVFVTNRKATGECDPTKENLAAVGIEYDGIFCRTDTSDKNPRFEAIEDAGSEIVLFVGDNILDFPDLSQDIRTEPDSAFAEFGHRFILLPNPMYGSWEKNT